MARMSYTPIPISVNQDARVMSLSTEVRLVYLCLRIGSDSHGRYRAGPMPLRIVAGILDPAVDIVTAHGVLESHGLVRSWLADDGQRYAEIVGYDGALTVNMLRRRGESEIEPPQTDSRDSHESVMSESRDSHEVGPRRPRGSPTHDSGVSESRVTLPSRAGASLAEPSLAEPSPDTQTRAGAHEDERQDTKRNESVDLSTEATRIDPELSPPAIRWLRHRVEVTRSQGNAFACYDEADDLHGHTLRRLQRSPGFEVCVDKMLSMPQSRWGKTLRAGAAYLERMITEWIPESSNGTPPTQRHFAVSNLTPAEYEERYGAPPGATGVVDDETSRLVIGALREAGA